MLDIRVGNPLQGCSGQVHFVINAVGLSLLEMFALCYR